MSVSVNDAEIYKTCTSMQVTSAEREWLRAVAAKVAGKWPESVMVNIGVAYGASCHCLRAGALNARLFGVEIEPSRFQLEHPVLLNMTLLEGDSNVIWKDFPSDIHLLFIDGCHHKKYVLGDIAGWIPKLVVGGIVAFHDYTPSSVDLHLFPDLVGVRNAVDEWQSREQWEEIPAPDSIKAYRKGGDRY